jgi:PLP dependent protein
MVSENIRDIEHRIQEACNHSGRSRASVQLIGVTKTISPETINAAIDAGIRNIGENRIQEYLAKRPLLRDHDFHMIGHLQRNKVRSIMGFVSMIHSVDSEGLISELQVRAAEISRDVDILIEVNTSGEASKFGLSKNLLLPLAEKAISAPNLHLRGLMTVAEYTDNPEKVRPSFALLRQMNAELQQAFPEAAIDQLSMGMTSDFEVAIEEGATLIRLGTALFGERHYL